MRDVFIRGFEIVLSVALVLAAVAVAAAALGALMGEVPAGGAVLTGPVAALAILLGGWLAVLAVGGALFLGLGIYHETRRTADALELLIALRR
jgi:hypothetical protein